jgi:hypothetical protein
MSEGLSWQLSQIKSWIWRYSLIKWLLTKEIQITREKKLKNFIELFMFDLKYSLEMKSLECKWNKWCSSNKISAKKFNRMAHIFLGLGTRFFPRISKKVPPTCINRRIFVTPDLILLISTVSFNHGMFAKNINRWWKLYVHWQIYCDERFYHQNFIYLVIVMPRLQCK